MTPRPLAKFCPMHDQNIWAVRWHVLVWPRRPKYAELAVILRAEGAVAGINRKYIMGFFLPGPGSLTPDFRSRGSSKRVGDVFKCIGDVFSSNLHLEMGKTVGQPIRSDHFGILHFWEFFGQPLGENTCPRNAPSKNLSFVVNNPSFVPKQKSGCPALMSYVSKCPPH